MPPISTLYFQSSDFYACSKNKIIFTLESLSRGSKFCIFRHALILFFAPTRQNLNIRVFFQYFDTGFVFSCRRFG